MDEFGIEDNNDNVINNLISHIKIINYEIERLLKDKKESEEQLRECFSHYCNASKTYKFDNHKVTITDGYNYSLDKIEYERIKSVDFVRIKFPIINEVMKYELNKKAIHDCEKYGTESEKEILAKLIHKSPKKLHVSIKLNLQDLPFDGDENV